MTWKTECLTSLTSHISTLFPLHDAHRNFKKKKGFLLLTTSTRKGGPHDCLPNLSPQPLWSYKVTDVFLQHEGVGFLKGMQLATAETPKEKGAMQGSYTRTKKMLTTQWENGIPSPSPFIRATVTSPWPLLCPMTFFLFLIFMAANLPLLLCTFTLMHFSSKGKNHLQPKKNPFLKGNNGASRGGRKEGRAGCPNKWNFPKAGPMTSYCRCSPACP